MIEQQELLFNENGEIINIDELVEQRANEKVKAVVEAQNRQKDGYKKKLAMEEKAERKVRSRKQEKFYNCVTDSIKKLVEWGFTDNELCYLWYIGRNVDYRNTSNDSFVKLVKSQKNKEGLNNRDIRKIIGLDGKSKDMSWQRFKNKLVKLAIVKEIDNEFYLNKEFIFKGEFGGVNVVSTNINKTNGALKGATKSQIRDMGLLMRIQPFISCVNMCLVENPDETDTSKIKYIQSLKQLYEVTGIDRQAYRRLWNMKINGYCVISEVKNANGKRYMLNHRLFFRGDYEEIEDMLKRNGLDTSSVF